MSNWILEGFDHQNAVADLLANLGSFQWRLLDANCTLPAGRFGGKALRFNSNTGRSSLDGYNSSSTANLWWGGALFMPPSTVFAVCVRNSSENADQARVLLVAANGEVEAYNGNGTLLGNTGANQFSVNAWFYLEVFAQISATTGAITVRVNGVQVLALTNVNTQNGASANVDGVRLGSPADLSIGINDQVELDDVYINDGGGTDGWSTFKGPLAISTLFPTSNVSVTFTPLANTNWQEVSETAMDSDTSYNGSTAAGNEDLFGIGSLPANVTPLAVQVTGAYRSAGGSSPTMSNHLKSGATEVAGTSHPLNTTYSYQRDFYANDPAIAGAWTVTTVNALNIGYKHDT